MLAKPVRSDFNIFDILQDLLKSDKIMLALVLMVPVGTCGMGTGGRTNCAHSTDAGSDCIGSTESILL